MFLCMGWRGAAADAGGADVFYLAHAGEAVRSPLTPPCQTNSTMPSCIKTRCCCLRLPPATHLPTTHDLIHTIISVFCSGKLPTDYDLLQYLLTNYLQHTTCYYHLLPTITTATSPPFQKHPARPDQNNKPTTATVGKAGNRSTLRLACYLLTHYTYTTYHRWTYYLTTYNIWLTTYYCQCYQQTVAKKKGELLQKTAVRTVVKKAPGNCCNKHHCYKNTSRSWINTMAWKHTGCCCTKKKTVPSYWVYQFITFKAGKSENQSCFWGHLPQPLDHTSIHCCVACLPFEAPETEIRKQVCMKLCNPESYGALHASFTDWKPNLPTFSESLTPFQSLSWYIMVHPPFFFGWNPAFAAENASFKLQQKNHW